MGLVLLQKMLQRVPWLLPPCEDRRGKQCASWGGPDQNTTKLAPALAFRPPEQREMSLVYKPPRLRHFVTAAGPLKAGSGEREPKQLFCSTAEPVNVYIRREESFIPKDKNHSNILYKIAMRM